MRRYLWLLLAFVLGINTAFAQLQPPFRKRWETPTTEQLQNIVLSGNQLYYGTRNAYGALDLATGKRLWEKAAPAETFGVNVTFHEGTLYVSVGQRGLLACDPATGATRWSVPGSYYGIAPLVRGERVLVPLKEGFLSAIHTRTHKPLWTRNLWRPGVPHRKSGMHGPLSLALRDPQSVLVGTYDNELFCLDIATGKPRWHRSFPVQRNGVNHFGITTGTRLYVCHDAVIEALDPQTGHSLWHFSDPEDQRSFTQAVLLPQDRLAVTTTSGTLYVLDARLGKKQWAQRVGTSSLPNLSLPRLQGQQIVFGADRTLAAFDFNGKRLWQCPPFAVGSNLTLLPQTADFIVMSWTSLARFERGGLPTDPTQRRALAQLLVAKLDTLSEDEQLTLDQLGDVAGELLLSIVRTRLERYRAKPQDHSLDALRTALERFVPVMRPEDTAALLALLDKTSNEPGEQNSRRALFNALVDEKAHSDPALLLPLALSTIRQGEREENGGFDAALHYVTHSTHPDAIAFLHTQLTTPNSDPTVRNEAYLSLVRTGGPAYVPDVLAARKTERQRTSLTRRFRLVSVPPRVLTEKESDDNRGNARVLATAKNSKGQLWALLSFYAIGLDDTLWVARWSEGKWEELTFTGMQQQRQPRIPQNWLARFTSAPALQRLRADSDGDGLTDVLEPCLGTNPHNPDSDSDGLRDDVDKNPLAAPRPLSDGEKVLSAAVEAFCHQGGLQGIRLIHLPPGIRPLEFSGPSGTIISLPNNTTSRKKALADALFQDTISFRPPRYDFDGAALRNEKTTNVILWNANKTEAKLQLISTFTSRSGAGFELRLKKFGNEWIVLDIEMSWIT